MRYSTMTAMTLAGALAIAPSLAATAADMNDSGAATRAPMKSTAPANMPAASQQYPADKLVGHSVKNHAGDTIGDINSIILDPNGKAAAVIVGVGGFLGMGEHTVAIDWRRLQIDRNGDDVTVMTDLTKADLKAMPAYTYPENAKRHSAFEDQRYVATAGAPARTGTDKTAARPEGKKVEADAQGRIYLSSLNGTDVINGNGDKIGEVEDVLVDKDGRPQLLVSVGGFLGIGERDVLVPWDQLKVQQTDRENVVVSLPMTKEQLKAIPEYKK